MKKSSHAKYFLSFKSIYVYLLQTVGRNSLWILNKYINCLTSIFVRCYDCFPMNIKLCSTVGEMLYSCITGSSHFLYLSTLRTRDLRTMHFQIWSAQANECLQLDTSTFTLDIHDAKVSLHPWGVQRVFLTAHNCSFITIIMSLPWNLTF